jgi:hypothetical protein
MREERRTYNGPAEIWLGDTKWGDVAVELFRWQWTRSIRTVGPESQEVESAPYWEGRILELSRSAFDQLDRRELEIRLPNGRGGKAYLQPADGDFGRLATFGPAPFD